MKELTTAVLESKFSSRTAPLVGVVLAGGTARRYGTEKALLQWKGKTFLEIAAQRLERICEPIVVSVDKPGRFDGWCQWREIPDIEPGGGAAVGILSVLRVFSGCAALVVPVDMPLIPESLLRRLIRRRGDVNAVALKVQRRWQPLVGIYEPEAAPVIEKCLRENEKKIVAILRRLKVRSVPAREEEKRFLLNINTPQDFVLLSRYNPL